MVRYHLATELIMDNRHRDWKCLLCEKRNADKTGSHIVPSFIMKRINGDGLRDHEVGFIISGAIVEPYFGIDIYEDKRRAIIDYEEKLELCNFDALTRHP